MARPVEQPVASPAPPARTIRRAVPRGTDAEAGDFRTTLRGAGQKASQQDPAVPAEPSRKPDAAKKPAAKTAGKPARVRKQQGPTAPADGQPVAEPIDAQHQEADTPTSGSIDATAQSPEAEGEDQPAEQTLPSRPADDAAQAAVVPSAIAAPVFAVDVQPESPPEEGESDDAEVDSATATSPHSPQATQTSPHLSSAGNSEMPLNASPVRGPVVSVPAAQAPVEVQANPEAAEQPATESVGGIAIPREMEMVDGRSVDESPDDVQLPKVDLKPQSAALPQVLSPDVPSQPTHKLAPLSDAPAPPAPEARFVEANHDKIVSAVHGRLLPDGGQMRIRLDPPELGTLWVRVQVQGGLMTASFETTTDQATRALSHSLAQLKHALEAGGMTVDKLQVAQAPRGQEADLQGQRDQQHQQPGSQDFRGGSSQRDQQRQELIQKMWEKIALGRERVDLKA